MKFKKQSNRDPATGKKLPPGMHERGYRLAVDERGALVKIENDPTYDSTQFARELPRGWRWATARDLETKSKV